MNKGLCTPTRKKREQLSDFYSPFYLCSDICQSPKSTVLNIVSFAAVITDGASKQVETTDATRTHDGAVSLNVSAKWPL